MKPLVLPYKVFPSSPGTHTFSAMLNVQVSLPASHSQRTKRFEALIDSGASRCLFHTDFAEVLGIDLTACSAEVTVGISGREHIYLHEVNLYAPGGPAKITAGFMRGLPVAGLLGMTGFFDHFRVTFDPTENCCILERLFQA